MAENFAPATLSTPFTDIDFNQENGSGDIYFITSIDGLDGEPLRTPMDDQPLTDGALVYDFFSSARHVTITGWTIPGSAGRSQWQRIAQRNQMERTLRLALRSIKRADGSWIWTPTGLSTYTLTVRNDAPLQCPGEGIMKQFIFGLVAADPDFD